MAILREFLLRGGTAMFDDFHGPFEWEIFAHQMKRVFPDRDIPFVGLNTQELHGRHVQKVELGAQWQFLRDVFARLRWNAGNVFDRWTWDPAGYVGGFGVELGAKTVAGRLNLSASGSGHTRWPRVELDLGLPF